MTLGYTKSMCAAAMTGAHLQAPAPGPCNVAGIQGFRVCFFFLGGVEGC